MAETTDTMEFKKKSELQKNYSRLRDLVLNMDPDLKKAELNHNKAAGTRVRGSLQEVKNLAQTLRKLILETRG